MSPTSNESFATSFLKLESAGGILLFFAAVAAIVLANSPFENYYSLLLDTPLSVQVSKLIIAKPLLLWINDGLMAVFFFLVGLELKRELVEGELSDRSKIILPAVGALGGMVVPALIYAYFNSHDPVASRGWAIPAATDIAFALGVLTLLGSRVPTSIKVFLTSLAIFDDIGAIIIIAFFYTEKISAEALIIVGVCIVILFIMNRCNAVSRSSYLFIAMVMWVAMLKSGIHATLAGVIIAMFIPMRDKSNPAYSPLKSIEHDLHSVVAFVVLPVFAFANAGINLEGVTLDQLFHGVPMGIILGLFVGKQLGIFGMCWLAVKMKLVRLPSTMSMASLYGTALLCGIGFTMSLFIGSLAFADAGVHSAFDERIGIILGSLLSGVAGYLVLRVSLPKKA